MRFVMLRGLTSADAETAIAEIWISVERLGSANPILTFGFHDHGARLSILAEFEDETIAKSVARGLSLPSFVEESDILVRPYVADKRQLVSQESP